MLEEGELVGALKDLGIDEDNYRILSLLPFVLVAWSDGKVQRAERSRIVELARSNGFLTDGGEAVLADWLKDQPLPDYYDRGFKILIELARRERGIGANMNAQTLRELVDLSFDIARAAGGLFGKAWSISPQEKTALDSVADVLSIDDGKAWKELLEDIEKSSQNSQ